MAATTLGALARIARRDALRQRRHSLLLLAMIALPVAGLAAGATVLDSLWQRPTSDWIQRWGSLVVVAFWVLAAIALVAAVLMVSAAVTIATRRQLRALGLLAAAGTGGHQLAAVVILQAAALGLGGVLAGILAGLLVARALLPRLARAMNFPSSEVPSLLVAPGRLLLAAGLGLLATVVAALVPAIRAARLPVTQALAAQQPPARHPRRLTIVGIVLVLVGLGLAGLQVWVAGSRWQAWAAVASVPAVLVGFAALSRALVALVGRSARWLPATGRLAVRDLSRHSCQARARRRSPPLMTPRATRSPSTGRSSTNTASPPARGLAIGDQELLVAMGGEQAAAAFAGGAVVVFGTNVVPDGQVTLAITDLPRPARHITVPAVEVTTGSYLGETPPPAQLGDPEGDKRSVTELEADEVGASLKWATAKVERASQRGNGDRAQSRERAAERGGDFNEPPPF